MSLANKFLYLRNCGIPLERICWILGISERRAELINNKIQDKVHFFSGGVVNDNTMIYGRNSEIIVLKYNENQKIKQNMTLQEVVEYAYKENIKYLNQCCYIIDKSEKKVYFYNGWEFLEIGQIY